MSNQPETQRNEKGKKASTPPVSAWEKEYERLETLRTRVLAAVDEIARLRAENTALQKRLTALQTHHEADAELSQITLDTNPAALREKINRFIDTIDQYLNHYSETESAS